MLVDGYVVEGHVPVGAINKLLTERPKIKGVSLPGMPEGSPEMTGQKAEPFRIYEISCRFEFGKTIRGGGAPHPDMAFAPSKRLEPLCST